MDLDTLRHSASHILAIAVKKHNPKVKLAIGPSIEEGFYYDFDNLKITEETLKALESSMKNIIKQNLKFEKKEISKKEARKLFADEPYKLELIEELPGDKVSTYKTGDFVDLCKGPHVKSTKEIGAVKLVRIAGAYWRGSEKNKMLTRIYGTAFAKKEELETYIKQLEYAEVNNHIVLGKKLKLFAFFPKEIGSGLPILLPKGATIRRILERFIEDEELRRGYQRVFTPDFAKEDLYKISGHLPKYEDGMYPPMKKYNSEFRLKPMTCPMHAMVFKESPRSYKELPLRIAELAKQYRVEKSGEMSGLIRVAHFTLADSHIFCSEEQAKAEVKGALDLILYCMETLGLGEWRARLSLRDPKSDKYVKNDKLWETSTKLLRACLKEMKVEYFEQEGEAAFYGPKIDIQMKNIHGKEETILTVQVDYHLPEKFDLEYTGEDGRLHRPVMVHRSSVGCIERTLAFLIEKYAGAFPTWLAPVQVKLINFTDRNLKYAQKIEKALREEEIRIETDYDSGTIQRKIRDAEMEKVPYILVVGDKEQDAGTIAVRTRGKQKVEFGVELDKFIEKIKKEIAERKLVP